MVLTTSSKLERFYPMPVRVRGRSRHRPCASSAFTDFNRSFAGVVKDTLSTSVRALGSLGFEYGV